MQLPLIDRRPAKPLLGLCLTYPAAGIVERIGPDWDWIWIDAQHGDLDFREAVTLVRAAHLVSKPSLVRVASHDPGWIGKILDAGAAGVIVPMVESVAEAAAMVTAAKFPPVGNRSYGGRRIIDLVGRTYASTANRDTVLILQVESMEAVAIADQLAALDGVDGLFLGPDDLLIRQGREVDTPKDDVSIGAAVRTVAAACRRHGKLIAGIGAGAAMIEMARAGRFDLVVGGSDVKFLAAASVEAARNLRIRLDAKTSS